MPRELARITQMSPADILKGLNLDMVRAGYAKKWNVSTHLEHLNPTDPGDKSGLDAFGRVMKEAGIVTRSVPADGVYADTWEEAFHGTDARRILGMEWMMRTWRRASFAGIHRGGWTPARERSAILQSGDYAPGGWERPFEYDDMVRLQQIAPAIPLTALVAVTTGITSDEYKAVYIEDVPADQKRFVRVGETAEIPRVQFKSAERGVTLYKYGRAIEASYEVIRRQRLNRIAVNIALIAVQVQNDKVATALDVIVNGDGNAGTAAPVTNLTSMNGSLANAPQLADWIAFKMLFKNPYHMTALLGQQGPITKAMLINTGSANHPLVSVSSYLGLGGFRLLNENLSDTVAYGVTDDAPANRWVGFDQRFALERIFEINADITEVERFATRQTEVLVMTEVEGFMKFDKRAAHVVRLDA